MKTIKCENTILDESHRPRKCGRILAVLTDMQVEILRAEDSESPVFRCPKCPPEQRWSTIKFDKATNGFLFKVLDEHPEFHEEMKFSELEICEQVG